MLPSEVSVQIRKLPHAPAELPAYESDGAAGMDLRYAGDRTTIAPGERVLLPTGYCIAIPTGFEGQIRLRSGFALRSGLILPNAPGTVDSDYRGEVQILVMNPGSSSITVERGDRVAQLVIAPVCRCVWSEVEYLPPSARGSGGFGSTGYL
ncbi:dUTP diphosphatase [bacterium]|nr:dUTP diphosphatase [bacterium]MBU1984962.1 dUTP diphosphatase [bacterium]